MDIILREDVDKLGTRGQVVKVAAGRGYARNFLLPRRLAAWRRQIPTKKIVEQERQGGSPPPKEAITVQMTEAADLAKTAGRCRDYHHAQSRRKRPVVRLRNSRRAVADALDAQKFNIDRRKDPAR